MRVKIDADLCQGHGMCRLACPAVFGLNDEDGHAFLIQEDVPAALEDSVGRAISSCPEQAITAS
jgi:ferredoxin